MNSFSQRRQPKVLAGLQTLLFGVASIGTVAVMAISDEPQAWQAAVAAGFAFAAGVNAGDFLIRRSER